MFQHVTGPEHTLDVPPMSRTTISLRNLFGDVLAPYRFGVLITSLPPADAPPGTSPPEIVVDRASYFVSWSAGTSAPAVRVR